MLYEQLTSTTQTDPEVAGFDMTALGGPEAADDVSEIRIRTSVGALKALVCVPATRKPGAPPFVALHGISRDAQGMFNAFRDAPKSAGRVIVAPIFEAHDWPVFQRITDRNRPDIALLDMLTTLRAFGVIGERAVEMFGFSGGAQLAHRFAMLYPHMISALHVSSAGWYSLPQADAPYPYGLDASASKEQVWPRRMAQGLEAFLRLPVSVYVGADDTVTDEPALRRNPALDASQGRDRRTRAAAYRDALRAAKGAKNRVRYFELPGCGHSFDECVSRGGLVDLVLS